MKDEASSGDDVFFTLTMAEILEKQGQLEDALMIYKILSDRAPGDMALRLKVEKLKIMAHRMRERKRV